MASGWVRKFLIYFAVCTFIGLLSFSTFLTEERLENGNTPASLFLINELTGSYSYLPLVFLAIPFIRRFQITRQNFVRFIPIHLLGSLVLGALHTTLMTLSRTWLYPLAGLNYYDPGNLGYRYLLEYQKQILIYTGIAVAVHLLALYREKRQQEQRASTLEVRTAQLQSRLAQARLESLRSQLQPHFLFNTLNMISSVMYEDPEMADRMITRLGHLLRISLEQSDRPKVRLEEELLALEAYLDIMRSRFPDRLCFEVRIDPQLSSALVPGFLLQPLVENSIKYGGEASSGPLWIGIEAREGSGRCLHISIKDSGPGTTEPVVEGYGLSSARQRLRELYGDVASFEYRNSATGFDVSIEIPYEVDPVEVLVGAEEQ